VFKILFFYLRRYCAPCSENLSDRIGISKDSLEGLCLNYTRVMQNPNTKAHLALKYLIEKMNKMKHQFTWVVYAYSMAMASHEIIFEEPYDLNVFVQPTPMEDTCIKIFQSGEGFGKLIPYNRLIERDKINQNIETYNEGKSWENYFVYGLRDLWAVEYCHGKHQRFVSWNEFLSLTVIMYILNSEQSFVIIQADGALTRIQAVEARLSFWNIENLTTNQHEPYC